MGQLPGDLRSLEADYGITIDGTATEGEYSSGQELDSIKNTGKPDVGDVGISFAVQAKTDGLSAPYKHSFWADIPPRQGRRRLLVLQLLGRPGLRRQHRRGQDPDQGLEGSPRSVPQERGRHRRRPDQGERLLLRGLVGGHRQRRRRRQHPARHRLHEPAPASGNLTAARASDANILSGEVKVAIKWDYLGLAVRDKAAGAPNITVTIPSSGSLASPYADIVAAKAPHPNAAKLWQELIYSDAAQLLFLKGYAHPIRYDALNAAGKIPADLAAKLPSADLYKKVTIVTDIDKITAAKTTLGTGWKIVVNS
jgi:putative spermidine/putrescine transport system substrate-binding protein